MPATQPAQSDQASRAAVRGVMRSLGGRGQLPDAPGSWVAQAGSSDGTFTYSEAVVRLVSADVMLPGDRPGIVTDFVRAHMSCLWLLPSLNCQISSATEHLYLDVMSGGELGCR